ncbi:hypothetical protein ATANTOWER_012504 [Ataeniobius toweri]|uniref:Uncharacterized protein n=1 Tax=Ataeniobius toweri TaxID=208326 RepID=A0ABU7A6L7_9TELE|nr:hypothetical protein [Ataeniobius toweri]
MRRCWGSRRRNIAGGEPYILSRGVRRGWDRSAIWLLFSTERWRAEVLNRRRSSDVTGSINRLRWRVSWPFPACLTGQCNGGAYLERQKLAGELLLHKAIPGRA